MLSWLLLFWMITAIEPHYREDWLLENLLVFVTAILLLGAYHRFQFSRTSYALITIFITLHLIGAHYTYSETPFGFWMQDWFGFSRNHYDRLIHFAFGLLIAYPFREFIQRKAKVTDGWASIMAVTTVLAFSAFFELLEAIAAMIVNPELGAAYLGTQGDEWDSQKDTLLAWIGGIIAMITMTVYRNSQGNSFPN